MITSDVRAMQMSIRRVDSFMVSSLVGKKIGRSQLERLQGRFFVIAHALIKRAKAREKIGRYCGLHKVAEQLLDQ